MEKLLTLAEIKVSYHPNISYHPQIVSSLDSYVVFKDFFPEESINLQERFIAMYLNRSNRVLGVYPISIGGITGTVADTRLILSVALKTAAVNIILAHNHPSGNLKPSNADIELTRKVKESARLMDINVMDHIILSPVGGQYFSFADDGII